MEENIYYVYQLINPLNNQPFYIGFGKKTRVESHWKSFVKKGFEGCDGNYDKYCVLKKIQKAGLKPIEKIITNKNLSKKNAVKLETLLIKKYGRIWDGSGILTNIKEDESKSPMEIKSIRDKVSNTLKGRNVIREYFLKTGRTIEDYCKFVEDQNKFQSENGRGENNPNYNNKWSEKQKKRMSLIKMQNNTKGYKKINNGEKEKCVKLELANKYIKCGWKFGRLNKSA